MLTWHEGNPAKEDPGKWSPFKDYGVYSFGDMVLDGGSYNKDIGTAKDQDGSITLKNNPVISKNVRIPKDNTNIINGSVPPGKIKNEEPLKKPRLPDMPSLENGTWKTYNGCPTSINITPGENNIYLENLTKFNCNLTIKGYNTSKDEVNILIDNDLDIENSIIKSNPENIPINIYVNGNVTFKGAGSQIYASIYAKEDIISKKSGSLLFGSLISDGNITIAKEASGLQFFGEVIYASKEITFNGSSSSILGPSIIGEKVVLNRQTVFDWYDYRQVAGSLSLKELDNRPPNDNEGSSGDNGGTGNSSNGRVDFKIQSPLHEVNK